MSQGNVARHEGAEGVLQGNVARYKGAKRDTKLACCKAMWLGMCRKAMWLGTKVPKATQSLHVTRQCG
ncbi:unnamed protein product [Prunus armeniaca]